MTALVEASTTAWVEVKATGWDELDYRSERTPIGRQPLQHPRPRCLGQTSMVVQGGHPRQPW